jgi:putative IMPACT (imprinted ancient) family translation regulator
MLDVLRHQDLEGVLATVVRYFGGVKLGAGGLVRAYTDAVAQALLQAEKVAIQRMQTLQCTVPYPLEGLVRRMADTAGAELLEVDHGSLVRFKLQMPEADAAQFVSASMKRSGPHWLAQAGRAVDRKKTRLWRVSSRAISAIAFLGLARWAAVG